MHPGNFITLKCSLVLLCRSLSSSDHESNLYSHFCHHRLVLSLLELRVKGIRDYIIFCNQLLSFHIMHWGSSLHILVILCCTAVWMNMLLSLYKLKKEEGRKSYFLSLLSCMKRLHGSHTRVHQICLMLYVVMLSKACELLKKNMHWHNFCALKIYGKYTLFSHNSINICSKAVTLGKFL